MANRAVIRAFGVEEIITDNFKSATVKFVSTGSGVVGDDALRQAVLRGERRPQYVELVNQIKRRIPDGLETLGFRLSHRNTVEYHFVLEIDAAVDALAERVTGYAGRQKDKAVNLSAASTLHFKRQFLHDFVFNRRVEIGLRGVQRNRILSDLHGLGGASSLQRGIDRGRVCHFDTDVAKDGSFESRILYFDGIGTG